jgi:hypothetical protein
MVRRHEIVGMIAQGMPVLAVSEKLGISKQCVRRHMHVALAAGEHFPSNLTPEAVAELRTIEAEGLTQVKAKLHAALGAVKVSDAVGVARLGESYAKIFERLCKLLGLDAPIRILEQQLRLELKQGEDNVVRFAWDQAALETDWRTVPGLQVNGAAAALEDSNNDELHPAAA